LQPPFPLAISARLLLGLPGGSVGFESE